MEPFALFRCLGKALLKHAGNVIGLGIGGLLAEVGEEAWEEWRREKNEALRRAELQEIAQAAAAECRLQVEAVVREVAGQRPVEIRHLVESYLDKLPDLVRQRLKRPEDPIGTTVPPHLSLRSFEDLLPFLPGQSAEPPPVLPFVEHSEEIAETCHQPGATVTLVVTQGKLAGTRLVFSERAACILGRAKDCHPRLPDDPAHRAISRHHCLLDINPPDIRVRDFGSLNGTHVNGELIGRRQQGMTPDEGARLQFSERDLKDSDQIKLGNTVFQVQVSMPTFCMECSAPIPEQQKSSAKRQPGGWVCTTCQQKSRAASILPATPVIRLCARCGRDVSAEAGDRRQGDYLCAACRSDPVQILKHLLAQARAGQPEAQVLRGFHYLEELGRGGMGAVFLLAHEQTDERLAVKLMLPKVAARERNKQQFLREVEATKALRHRHVVQLRDAGCSGGVFFFTLEYCRGGSVDQLMKQRGGSLPQDEAIEISLQALEGLEYAHNVYGPGRGLVHRDFSPHNLFLEGSGSARLAKVGDFGLAKAFDQAGLSGQTRTGETAGKPYFMPRQQVINFKYATPAVDVWALAASLYAMLTGAVPRDFAAGCDPWLVVLETDPVPVRQRNPRIPIPLAEVIDLALVDKPSIHFQTAAEFREALEGAL